MPTRFRGAIKSYGNIYHGSCPTKMSLIIVLVPHDALSKTGHVNNSSGENQRRRQRNRIQENDRKIALKLISDYQTINNIKGRLLSLVANPTSQFY